MHSRSGFSLAITLASFFLTSCAKKAKSESVDNRASFARYQSSDKSQAAGVTNNICDVDEACVFIEKTADLLWAFFGNPTDFKSAKKLCEEFVFENFKGGWRLPTEEQMSNSLISSIGLPESLTYERLYWAMSDFDKPMKVELTVGNSMSYTPSDSLDESRHFMCVRQYSN